MTKVAVITGAASGIGYALAEHCVAEGMQVVIADKAENLNQKAEALRKAGKTEVLPIACDVTNLADVNALAHKTFENFSRVDWLFNNAGIIGPLAPIWELSMREIREVIEVNLYGVIHGIQAFIPKLFGQEHRSHIINMASLYGLCSSSQTGSYAMSKHALLALSESLYFDLRRLNKPVDISVVCPSFMSTQLLASSEEGNTFQGMLSDLIQRSRPPNEVAKIIIAEVKKNIFYILPDNEVKNYCEERTSAILGQNPPYVHSVEKIIQALSKRA